MPFNLGFPTHHAGVDQLDLEVGEILFVLGANGSGKSALMLLFNQQNERHARKIAAHRQTWMVSDTLDMTSSHKVEIERDIHAEDRRPHSRYRDQYADRRASMTIYDLIDAENARARQMAQAFDARDMTLHAERAKVQAPITVINELLQQSNIPIKITIGANDRLMARKDGGAEYSAAELSDGERNALLIAGNVLTAPPGTLLIIDEPERHLHRSIITPLLSQLFNRRADCSFVISTHDHHLPLANPAARTLLVRSCSFNGHDIEGFEADELSPHAPIDDDLKRDLLGARQRLLFVEGTESSLDKPLYDLLFPMVSVIPKGNCRDVEQAVVAARAAEEFHWLRAFGIVDGDGFGAPQIAAKRERGVYATPYYSVEAIYFHPQIIGKIAVRQASVSGGDSSQLAKDAIASGVSAIRGHTGRLSEKAVKKALRKAIWAQLPDDEELLTAGEIKIVTNAAAVREARIQELDGTVSDGNWEAILIAWPVRESDALQRISQTLGFRKRHDYEKAVRHLLSGDPATLRFVRDFFGDLAVQIHD